MVSFVRRKEVQTNLINDLQNLDRFEPYNLDEAEKNHSWRCGERNYVTSWMNAMSTAVTKNKQEIMELTIKIRTINAKEKAGVAEQKDLYDRQTYTALLWSEDNLGPVKDMYKDTWFELDDDGMYDVILTKHEAKNIFHRVRYRKTSLYITPLTYEGNVEYQDKKLKRAEKTWHNSVERNIEPFFRISSTKDRAQAYADLSRIEASITNLILEVKLLENQKAITLKFLGDGGDEEGYEEGAASAPSSDGGDGDDGGGDTGSGREEKALIRQIPREAVIDFVAFRELFKDRPIVK